jgi:hypothetical protein
MDNLDNNLKNEVILIIKNINLFSEQIADVIEEINIQKKEIVSDATANKILSIYKERNRSVNQLKTTIEANQELNLLENNPEWDRYINEIVHIEKKNIEFLEKKIKDTKSKLSELFTNKSLMIYNQKVGLSYENRFL